MFRRRGDSGRLRRFGHGKLRADALAERLGPRVTLDERFRGR
ncbi:hypothetical protein K377_05780 [Streptomyces sp. PsTaAH-137]|nr:hypothetical protein K377_05780 [Streptomyces sp. PsTaAH-137]